MGGFTVCMRNLIPLVTLPHAFGMYLTAGVGKEKTMNACLSNRISGDHLSNKREKCDFLTRSQEAYNKSC